MLNLFGGAYEAPVKVRKPRKQRVRHKPLAYRPSFGEDFAAWPACWRCHRRYSPMVPTRTKKGTLVPRIYCNHCNARLCPLLQEHVDIGQANKGLVLSACREHRKDLLRRTMDCKAFKAELVEWAAMPVAIIARRYDPARGAEFSTYAVAALRNFLNAAYPPTNPFGVGGDRSPIDSLDKWDEEIELDDESAIKKQKVIEEIENRDFLLRFYKRVAIANSIRENRIEGNQYATYGPKGTLHEPDISHRLGKSRLPAIRKAVIIDSYIQRLSARQSTEHRSRMVV